MAISSSQTLLPPLLLCLLLAAALNLQPRATWALPITLPGCPDKCGNISIPYPFGTKEGCFRPGFLVICNDTFDPPRAFLDSDLTLGTDDDTDDDDDTRTQIIVTDEYTVTQKDATDIPPERSPWPIELVDVSVSVATARVLGAFSYDCQLNKTHRKVRRQEIKFSVTESPFVLSDTDNDLIAIGDDVVAEQSNGPLCQSFFFSSNELVNGSCSGHGCCHTTLAPVQTRCEVTVKKTPSDVLEPTVGMTGPGSTTTFNNNGISNDASCSYAMIVDKSWYNFTSPDVNSDAFLRRNAAGVVPVVVDFNIGFGLCPKAGEPTPDDFACVSKNSVCVDRLGQSMHFCSCSVGYEGNPYIQEGCQDIDECARPDSYQCHGKCKNTPGDYECNCPAGTRGNAKKALCTDLFSLPAKISVGAVGGLFIMALLVSVMLIRNEKRKMLELFKKNGGPTLERAKNIKIYKKEELNPILKRSNFIGRGAFGEVYKGFLDNQLVAVKRPIDGNVAQTDQFANEVIIQSQVIHKNIVKLIGCCLEVDKPMLVYEFLSRGSLDDILHGSSRVPVTLEQRLNIAAESAEGLAYMHSKTTSIILHGDVKPANILLNDGFTPKISDFGISRLIVMDKEHTNYVIGDRTYMDPAYIQDGLLTDKSDVYSFGVVLLELISRKKATYSDNNSLVKSFLDAHKNQKEATELFDKELEIAKPEVLKILDSLYKVAVSCLNLEVDKRPKMTDVEETLKTLKRDLVKYIDKSTANESYMHAIV